MSQYANPEKAYVWLDGDAFRGAAGMDIPADPFAEELADLLPFGGVEAGFELTSEQAVNKLQVFNYRKAAYKVARDPLTEGCKFRAVDNSKATVLTRAQGGKVTKVGEYYAVEKGIGEEFSLLIRLDDGDDKMAVWCERCTLSGPATRAAIDGKSLDGYEFTIEFLVPAVEILPGLPEGMTVEGDNSPDTSDDDTDSSDDSEEPATKTITLPEGVTGGVWSLAIDGKKSAEVEHNANATTVQVVLRNVAGGKKAKVTGEAGGPYTITGVKGEITAKGDALTGGASTDITVK